MKEEKREREGSPGSPVGRTQCFHCHGPGTISGWGTNIPQVLWHSEKNQQIEKKIFLKDEGIGFQDPSGILNQ